MRGLLFVLIAIGFTPTLYAAAPSAAPSAQMNELQHRGYGIVKAMNPQSKVLTLDHGAIKSLGWPAMTMNFTVQTQDALRTLKVGDRVEFDLAKGTDGKYLIMRIVPAK